MVQTSISQSLNEYRRQVAWLLVQADECESSTAGVCAAVNFRRRARNLQTLITRYDGQHP